MTRADVLALQRQAEELLNASRAARHDVALRERAWRAQTTAELAELALRGDREAVALLAGRCELVAR